MSVCSLVRPSFLYLCYFLQGLQSRLFCGGRNTHGAKFIDFLAAHDRGRALAAYGRGDRAPEIFAKLQSVHKEVSQVGLTYLLPEIEAALRAQ